MRFNEIASAFKGKRVAVLGDLMLDVYVSGQASRISQEAPVPVVRVKNTGYRLGGAANVMLNLSVLGAEVSAFGVAGGDRNGEILRNMLAEKGIRADGVLTDPARRTTEKQRVVASSQQVVRIDYEDVFPVDRKLKDQIAAALKDLITAGKIDAIVFEDYAKGMLDRELLATVIAEAAPAGVLTALDPHVSQLLETPGLTLLKPNRGEAFMMAGAYCTDPVVPVENDAALTNVAGKLAQTWQPENLLISLGAQGLALFEKSGGFTCIPTRAREVYDVSGAGDTVISAFILSLLGGAASPEAADIANHAAGIVCGKFGTAEASIDELRESYEQEEEA